MKTSDGLHTWIFDVVDGQFLFDAAQSDRVAYYPYGSRDPQELTDGVPFVMSCQTERLPDETTTALLEVICSSPVQSSNPGAYIEAHPEEYALLLRCSDSTIRYCFARFSEGGQTDLQGHIMANLCRDIISQTEEIHADGLYMTGQDWFDSFAAHAEELAADPVSYPCHAFALECLGR